MTLFAEGSDPLDRTVGDGASPDMRSPIGLPPPQDPGAAPPLADTISSAFAQYNPVQSVMNAISSQPGGEVDPNWDPLSVIKGTKYEDHLSSFIGSPNEAATSATMAQIDQEDEDRATLSASGWSGTAASVAAGLLDPTMLIGWGAGAHLVESGADVWKAARTMGTVGLAQSLLSSTALQASQVTRPVSDDVWSIASNTLLMGILGGAHAWLTAPEAARAEKGLDAVRDGFKPAPEPALDLTADAQDAPPTVGPEPTDETARIGAPDRDSVPLGGEAPVAMPAAASAAPSDTRDLVLKPFVLDSVPGVKQLMAKSSPTMRIFSGASLVAKRAMADLAETALTFTQNDRGVPTALNGPPIDRMSKLGIFKGKMRAGSILQQAFTDYRYGKNAPSLPGARAAIEDLRGTAGDKMSFADFKKQVSTALYSGDQHPIPQVQQAAQRLRAEVFDPVKKLAQSIKGPDGQPVLGEAVEAPKGDASFFPRIWNKEAIAARRGDFRKAVSDWLQGEQSANAATKDRLIGLRAQRDEIAGSLDGLDEEARAEAEQRLAGVREKIEDEVRNWRGNTAAEAMSALSRRAEAETARAEKIEAGQYQGKGERLTSADSAVDRFVDRAIASDRDLSRQELESRADEIIDRILGSPDGRLPYDIASGGPNLGPPGEKQVLRSSLRSRDFAIPTHLVKDFVEHDTEHAVGAMLRTVIPDLLLTQRFGDVDMTNTFRALNEEFAARSSAAKSEAEATRIEKERQATIRDLAATRDRVRNVYGWSPDPRLRNAARVANAFRNWNALTDLGTSVFNRLGDSTNAVFRYGLMDVFRHAWAPYFKGLVGMSEIPKAARGELKAMAVGVDGALGNLQHQLSDVTESYRPGNKFERGLAWSADKSMLLNLHGPWTDWMKTMSSTVAAHVFLGAAKRIAEGAGTARDIQRMAQSSIDTAMAARIWKAFSNGGGDVLEGTRIPSTASWSDAGARDAFEAAMAREADINVITPGAEKPLWMSSPISALIGQFKSFVAGANERLLISNLQQRDAATLQGLMASMATGMLSYRLYTLLSGQQASDRPQDWIKEAIMRSAVTGWFSELNQMSAKFTAGGLDAFRLIGADRPLSRFQDSSPLSDLLGPTWSHLEGLSGSLLDASRGHWSASDTYHLREWVWLQNQFALRRLFDQAENGINGAIGIQPRDRSGAVYNSVNAP